MGFQRLVAAGMLSALALSATSALAGEGRCFRGRPLPECSSFAVFETGYSLRLNGPADEKHYFNGDFGWMWNRGGNRALGGAFFVGALSGPALHFHVGVRPRLRRWLSARSSLDVSLGPFIAPVTIEPTPAQYADPDFSDRSDTRLGWSAQVGYNHADNISYVVQVEALSARQASTPQPDVSFYAGARLGSGVGVVALAVSGVILGLAGLAMSGS
ncbi:MAG: hypothetical protein Q7W05_14015 [Deltaproteobacteria bacterium]|nr:hypothetical protein [Deltaproteobacteria bacterium]